MNHWATIPGSNEKYPRSFVALFMKKIINHISIRLRKIRQSRGWFSTLKDGVNKGCIGEAFRVTGFPLHISGWFIERIRGFRKEIPVNNCQKNLVVLKYRKTGEWWVLSLLRLTDFLFEIGLILGYYISYPIVECWFYCCSTVPIRNWYSSSSLSVIMFCFFSHVVPYL